ncbi:MAG: COX15/CtaA family protein [Flavobacteriaceae bacterium]|nr:COX15/CtaA family protein [Flavobacteriaceae bacterium]
MYKKWYSRLLKTALVLVYLVILAGAVVRMTGSGMGCPDWPKCFGYLIPPTDEAVLIWQPNRDFEKGQMIIHDEALWSARSNFVSGADLDLSNFEKYTKHDYAIFNTLHTWTEYINRLFGALAGLAVLLTAVFSISYWKDRKAITLLSWLLVFMMVFQAWLGAVVVYSVLTPYKISIHMFMALAIVALQLYLLHTTRKTKPSVVQFALFSKLALATLALLLVQIFLGVLVRQEVDTTVKAVGYADKSLWSEALTNSWFYVHRSLSLLFLILNGWMFVELRKIGQLPVSMLGIVSSMFAVVLLGILMAYFDFPFLTQPLHMLLASILFGFQFWFCLKCFTAQNISIHTNIV